VVVANETLYLNRKDGFAGYGLKKDESIEKCSNLDDVIVFGKDGIMKVMKVAEKMFVGKSPLRVNVFRRDEEKVYNLVYRDGQSGRLYAKKFKIGGVTRDKEYPLFKTHSRSRIFFFAVHDNEKKNSRILVHLDPELKRIKEMVIELDFAWLDLQGRGAKGSTLTAHKVDRVVNAPKENGDDEDSVENSGKEENKISPPKEKKTPPKEKPVVPKSVDKKPLSQEKKGEPDRKDSSDGKDPKSQATFEF
jgi:topoisomerase-4 subunit A